MDRRDFLRTTGTAAAAATVPATLPARAGATAEPPAPALAKGLREIRVATSWPDNGKGPGDSARRLLRRIEVATEGRYRFVMIATDHQTGIEAVREGLAEAYHGCEHDHATHHRGFSYFAGLPAQHGLRASAIEAWLLTAGGQPLWDELAAQFGIKAFAAGHTGRSTGLWTQQAIASPVDLAGRKVWAAGLAGDVVRGLGAEPSMLPVTHIAGALARGEVFAAETGGAVTSYALGVLDGASHPVGTAINRTGSLLSFGLALSVWQEMSEADRIIFTALATAEMHTAIAEEKAHKRLLLRRYPKPGARDADARDFAAAVARMSDAVVAHLASHDPTTQRLNASYQAFRRAIGQEPAPTV